MAYYHRTSSSSMRFIPEPRQLADDNLNDPDSFYVYSYTVHPSSQKTPTRRIDPAKIPRRAIDLFAALKLKGRSTTKKRRRSTVMTIAGKERKSGNFSSELVKKKNFRETKISRPVRVSDGWEVGDLITSDHPGLNSSPGSSPPTPQTGDSSRPTTPLLPEPPSLRSMITRPPSQQSLPSIPPSPTSPVSVHLSLVSNLSGPPSHTQFFTGTPPPTGPLPQLPWAAQLNPRISPLSSSSPLTPPSLSLRGEQWPLRDDSRLGNIPKAQTVWPCPQPSRQPTTTPKTPSPSSIRPESRKKLPKTALSLWPAQEPSRKPLNSTIVSLSPNEPRSEPSGGKGQLEPSPWFPSPSPPSLSPRQGPLGEQVRMESSTRLISSLSRPPPRREPIGGEPEMDLSPWSTSPFLRQRPYGGEPLSSSPMSTEAETEPSASPRRPSHRRGPCGVNPQTLSPSPLSPSPRLGGETRMEPSQRLNSQAPREGSLDGEPSMETSPRLTSQHRQGPLGREPRIEPSTRPTNPSPPRLSPAQGPLGGELRTEPGPSVTRPSKPRGPCEGDLTTSRTPSHEPRTEPPTRLTGPAPARRGPFGGEPRASSSTYARPGMEPAPLLPRSTPRSEARVGSMSLEPNTVPFQPVTYPFSYCVPGSGPAPGPGPSSGLPPLPDIIEARNESVLFDFPITYHLALAFAKDKHTSEMAESEQQLEYLNIKTELYEDFFLALEAGRSSSVLGRGRREPRGRPGSLGELKFRLESQLRVMKAEETRISKGSGWF